MATMDQYITNFIPQLKESFEIGEKAQLTQPINEIRNIVVTGLGGSGIGGNLTYEFCKSELKVPIQVNKVYFVPKYVNENSLVIISSYSGNTEETLSALEDAIKKNAKIVCISSGGKVIEIAKEHNLDYILVPGGMPPRTCLGYSLTQQMYVLHKYNLMSELPLSNLRKALDLLIDEEEVIKISAKQLAKQLVGKIPVIYINAWMEPVAVRFRQQLNENSKILCWHHVIPEMNHNELVGWRESNDDLSVIFLRNDNDYPRIQQRIEINKEIIGGYCNNIHEVYSKGVSHVERAIYLINLCDWVSFYLSEYRDMDPVEVNVIDFLKNELAKGEFAG